MRNFETGNSIIRSFDMEDVRQLYFRMAKDEEVCDMCNCLIHRNICETEVMVKSFIVEYKSNEPVWVVEDIDKKLLIGMIKVINYSVKNKICKIELVIAKDYWNKDYMCEALKKVIEYLFVEKDIEIIESMHYENTKIIKNILENVGMTLEAVLRERRINTKTNERENLNVYSITKKEFMELQNNK